MSQLQKFSKKEAKGLMKMAILEEQRKMCRTEDIDYYAFSKDFSTTHGPFASKGSMGGSTVTTFIIEVWHNRKFDIAVFFCDGAVLSMNQGFSKNKIDIDYTKNNILKISKEEG